MQQIRNIALWGALLAVAPGCTVLVGLNNLGDDLPEPEGGGDGTVIPSRPGLVGGPGCVTDRAFFASDVQPVLDACVACHTEGGAAGHTRLLLQPGDNQAGLDANFSALQALGLADQVADPLYLEKPTFLLPHGGGEVIEPGGPEALALREMTNRFRAPGSCEDPGARTCDDVVVDVQAPVRRLSNAELSRTLAALFPSTTMPNLAVVANETRNLFDNQALSSSPSTLVTEYDHLNAQAIAQAVAADLATYLPCDAADGVSCGLQWVQQQGRRLFRRPLSTEEEDLFVSFFESGPTADDFDLSAEIALQAMLESPAFLYKLEMGLDPDAGATSLTPFETATRLSYLIWGTTPDDELLTAAEMGELSNLSGLEAQVDRLLADDRAVDGLTLIFSAWLDLEAVRYSQKPADSGFDDTVKQSLIEESRRFIRDIVLAEDATLQTVLTSDETFVNDAIAPLYGLNPPGGWSRVTHTEPRFGVLTQGGFLASRGHATEPSPIKRAKFVLERLMCFELGAPPPEAEGAEVEQGDTQTNRQATDALTLSGSCASCHSIINPVGYTFERYGPLGAMRDTDNGLPVDDSGLFASYTFGGVGDLADFLVNSEMVHTCVTRRFSQYALGHDVASGECFVEEVKQPFAQSGYDLKALVRAIATHPEFAFGTLDKSFGGGQP